MENPLRQDDKNVFIQGSVKRNWYLDGVFPWVRGEPAEDVAGLICLNNRQDYKLKDGDESFQAFVKLGACVDDDSALIGCEAKRIHLLPMEQFDKWLPMLQYVKKSEDGWREYTIQEEAALRERLYAWIRSYGMPHSGEYIPGIEYRMDFTDIAVIAHMAAMVYRLFELGRYKKNAYLIKKIAALITPSNSASTIVTFGIVARRDENPLYIPSQLITLLFTREPEKSPSDTWRKVANLWIGQVCKLFVDVKIEIRYTKQYLIRPTFKPAGLLSWLWLHCLSHIGEKEDQARDKKICQQCGAIITGRKAAKCENCTRQHKTWLKDRSRKRAQVIKLASEGKTLDEIQKIVNLAGYQTKEVIEWIDKSKEEAQS